LKKLHFILFHWTILCFVPKFSLNNLNREPSSSKKSNPKSKATEVVQVEIVPEKQARPELSLEEVERNVLHNLLQKLMAECEEVETQEVCEAAPPQEESPLFSNDISEKSS